MDATSTGNGSGQEVVEEVVGAHASIRAPLGNLVNRGPLNHGDLPTVLDAQASSLVRHSRSTSPGSAFVLVDDTCSIALMT